MNNVHRCLIAIAFLAALGALAGSFAGTTQISATPVASTFHAENNSDGSSIAIHQQSLLLSLKDRKFSFGLRELQSWRRVDSGLNLLLKDGTRLYFSFASVSDARNFVEALAATYEQLG